MSIQELCGLKAQEITNKIMEQNGSNAFQISQASNNAYNSAIASYDATLAANKGITNNIVEASEAAFTSSVVASSLASVTSTLMLNTIVSNTSIYLAEKNYGPDINHIKTLNYYWDLYPDLFGRIQIIYTNIDENDNIITDKKIIIENNFKYLNEYYNKGYRLFIGFGVSSTLAGVIPWFKNIGTEAKGISLNSSSSSLNFVKPVYRLRNNSSQTVTAYEYLFTNINKIYYVYNDNELVCLDVIPLLKKYNAELILYPVNPDASNLTLSDIKELYKNVDEKSVTVMFLFVDTTQSDFVNLFNDSYIMPTSTYDMQNTTYPKINETSKNALVNKYNYLLNISFSTSILFRNGLEELKTDFSTYVPNGLLLINKLAVNGNIDTLPANNSVLQFDENNDIKYFTYLNTIYSKDDKGEYYYKEDFYSIYDPIVGKKIFYVNN
jgi:hypothetical protein